MTAQAAYSKRYREDAMPSRQQVPPTGDPRWEEWCAPLLAFIFECPRTWDDLREWEKANGIRPSMTTHMVCWLEFHHRIAALDDCDPLLWIAKERDR
jgi:hypothetical protein